MSNPTFLSDFGAGIDEDDLQDDEAESSSEKNYRSGRCRAISSSTRNRCRSPISRMTAEAECCANHQQNPWLIDDPGEKLIMITGEFDALTLDELDEDEVDFDVPLVREALEVVGERWDPYA